MMLNTIHSCFLSALLLSPAPALAMVRQVNVLATHVAEIEVGQMRLDSFHRLQPVRQLGTIKADLFGVLAPDTVRHFSESANGGRYERGEFETMQESKFIFINIKGALEGDTSDVGVKILLDEAGLLTKVVTEGRRHFYITLGPAKGVQTFPTSPFGKVFKDDDSMALLAKIVKIRLGHYSSRLPYHMFETVHITGCKVYEKKQSSVVPLRANVTDEVFQRYFVH